MITREEVYQICVTLPLARELQDLGIEQCSLFYWVLWQTGSWKSKKVNWSLCTKVEIDWVLQTSHSEPLFAVSAFTVGERGLYLPVGTEIGSSFENKKNVKFWCKFDARPLGVDRVFMTHGETEVDARACLRVELIKAAVNLKKRRG